MLIPTSNQKLYAHTPHLKTRVNTPAHIPPALAPLIACQSKGGSTKM